MRNPNILEVIPKIPKMKTIMTKYANNIKMINGLRVEIPNSAIVAPINPATPNGAKCITQFVILNIIADIALRKSITIFPCVPIDAVPKPKRTQKKITGNMVPLDRAANIFVGTIDSRPLIFMYLSSMNVL